MSRSRWRDYRAAFYPIGGRRAKRGVRSYPPLPGEGKTSRHFLAATAASVTASQLAIITVPPVGAA
ncbi:hypothetical protein S23_66300 [Bradyrhizobium cosmicum]|uniref:Uncharacterized protein n=1 Tax=Bradyrhizobium cosmicum TaxID=1404864 RepID=A0AAI8QFI2_9BRAD|nr:hypothetical protein S23_66300 [Bradyrhizobium cosmicum]